MRSGRLVRLALLIPLLGIAILCTIPLVWLLFAPSKADAEIVAGAPLAFGRLSAYMDAWWKIAAFQNGILYQWIWNSVVYAFWIVLISIVTSFLAGYGLASLHPRWRRPILYLTLIAMIVPSAALVLPLFLEINFLGWRNRGIAVILPSALYPFGVYLAFIHFSTAIPKELIEAARIDGASELQTLRKIVLPLSKSLVGLLAFFSFVASWTNFYLPFVMLSTNDTFNLPLGLNALMANTPALNPSAGGTYLDIGRPEIAIAGILAVVPVAIVLAVSQRFLARGVLTGAVKS